MKRIAFIIPYFGKMNKYTQLWLNSCSFNHTIDWLLFTDDYTAYDYPSNVRVYYISFEEMKNMVQNSFNFKIELNRPYKLCDYKPAYGLIFKEYLKEYDFWGFCDKDLIFGDIRSFITEEILDNYVKILKHGHFTLLRNDVEGNLLFTHNVQGCTNYKEVFQSKRSFAFDEWGGLTPICEKLKIKQYSASIYADVNICYSFFQILFHDTGYIPQVFVWENGKLYRYYFFEGKVIRQDFLYIHLQKRAMEVKLSCEKKLNKYYIGPNSFFIDSSLDINYESLSRINQFKLYYPAWARLEFKWKMEERWQEFLGNIRKK